MEPSPDPRPFALAMPLLLFAQGIVAWVDQLDGRSGDGALGGASAVLLVATVASAFWLAALLAAVLPRGLGPSLGVVATGLGAGATTLVTLGDPTGPIGGVFDGVFGMVLGRAVSSAPAALTAGGPVLVGAGLALLLAAQTRAGRMPLGSLALAALAAVVVASPFGLVPLGAVLLLIALGPVLRGPEPAESVPARPHPAMGEPSDSATAAAKVRPAGGPAAYALTVERHGARPVGDPGMRPHSAEAWRPASRR
ncbi:hypothetical protein N865_15800 [Intrasporangium oryzae NRRL B-24470]|uniref:Uncharacterized protein n=1 Tax=Intrasporangium oryzae NRRL B-24470 TaxID=1386089 RepID=W9G2R2_9MICO|nr:hypothetical protein [Intrasporangium oryzae]EWT00411.1 hypothetical protein N865_15800 [Intrasporangium oryzae NRRL B-24470]